LNPGKSNWDWSGKILDKYPELDAKLKNIKQKEKREVIAKDYFEKFLENHYSELEKNTELFQKGWNRINDKFMKTLSKILKITWSDKDKIIRACVSLNPICPRYIKGRTFDMYYNSDISQMKSISVHEILHFLWFEKWKKIFPKTPERHFDSPYLEWQLSEMVPKTILCDERIQRIFPHSPGVYKEYTAMKIDGKPLLSQIEKFYYEKKDIEDFMKKSWKFVKEHKREINKK